MFLSGETRCGYEGTPCYLALLGRDCDCSVRCANFVKAAVCPGVCWRAHFLKCSTSTGGGARLLSARCQGVWHIDACLIGHFLFEYLAVCWSSSVMFVVNWFVRLVGWLSTSLLTGWSSLTLFNCCWLVSDRIVWKSHPFLPLSPSWMGGVHVWPYRVQREASRYVVYTCTRFRSSPCTTDICVYTFLFLPLYNG